VKLQVVKDYERLLKENEDLRYFNALFERRIETLERRYKKAVEELKKVCGSNDNEQD
jgi:cell division septum initiation protein DivIVA